jgi:hypothetical protein
LFLAFDAKRGERVDLGGVLIEGFVFLVCYIHASCLISHPAFFNYELVRLYFISCHLIGLAHKVVLPCLTPISYELCFMCTNSSCFIL